MTQVPEESPVNVWFELSYAQFLTIPRLVMESMPVEWQSRIVALLEEMDETFNWRPSDGRYWVRLRKDSGQLAAAPLNDYRRGSVEHLRRGNVCSECGGKLDKEDYCWSCEQ